MGEAGHFRRKSRLPRWILFLFIGIIVFLSQVYPVTRQMLPSGLRVAMRRIRALYLRNHYGARPALPGISAKHWRSSDVWVPATQSVTVSGSMALIALGAWWDEGYTTSALPKDTNGSFISAVTPKLGGPPVQVQVSYQAAAAAGGHSVTPPSVGVRGDGFFLLLEAHGLASSMPVRDSGYALNWHEAHGRSDSNNISNISVSTDSSAARSGDLVVGIIVQDSYEDNNQMGLPAGWTSLGVENSALDNICYRACYRIATSPGPQSLTCSWVSSSCFVAAAGIVVFKSDGGGDPSVRLVNSGRDPLTGGP